MLIIGAYGCTIIISMIKSHIKIIYLMKQSQSIAMRIERRERNQRELRRRRRIRRRRRRRIKGKDGGIRGRGRG